MGKTLYLECYSGISGDMTVAAAYGPGSGRGVSEAGACQAASGRIRD